MTGRIRGGAYITFSELFDRRPTKAELLDIFTGLPSEETILFLVRINLALRFALQESDKPNFGKTQGLLTSNFCDDEIFQRLKERLPLAKLDERALFIPLQCLNVLRLILAEQPPYSGGVVNDTEIKHAIGKACLMMNDLLLTTEEAREISEGDNDSRRLALMVQMLAPWEVVNPPQAHRLALRYQVMYRELLRQPEIKVRIAKQCRDFDFESSFDEAAGVPLER